MGGRALKNTFTRRYDRDEFEKLKDEMTSKLTDTFNNFSHTKYYHIKETFGDMDVLISDNGELTKEEITNFITNTFNPNEIFINGGCYSFDYKELQIDFIFIPTENFECAKHYFSYNDLGNLIGKIAHQFGLKYGQDGLKKVVFNENRNKLGTIYLTKNMYDALEFLGFNVERYKQGFDRLEDIFKFIRFSKYYNPYVFDFKHMNKINRDRDSKRSTYLSFIEYIKPDKNNKYFPQYKFFKNDTFYYGHINLHFPHFYEEYNALMNSIELKKQIKEKFNGSKIIEYYQRQQYKLDKNLGDMLAKFRTSFTDENHYNDFILSTPESEILNKFYQINKDE